MPAVTGIYYKLIGFLGGLFHMFKAFINFALTIEMISANTS